MPICQIATFNHERFWAALGEGPRVTIVLRARTMQSSTTVYLLHAVPQVRTQVERVAAFSGFAFRPVDSLNSMLSAIEAESDANQDTSLDSNVDRRICMIADIAPSVAESVALLDRTAAHAIPIPVIFVANRPATAVTVRLIKRGAANLLEISCSDHELRVAIIDAINRAQAKFATDRERQTTTERIRRLTEKERQVMELVVDGTTNRVIASRLSVSVRTVESRRQSIFRKLRVNTLAELIRAVVAADTDGN